MRTMIAVIAVCSLALASCATQDPVASIDTALTATGADGATYRLTVGTRLSFTTTAVSGQPNYDVNLDTDSTDVIFHAAPGSYSASLYNINASYTTVWPLQRTLNGVTDTVFAELLTPMPVTVAVTAGNTTNLAFQFAVAGGAITFGRGSVDVVVGVGQATGYTAGATGTGNVAGTPTVAGANPAALAALMPAAGATNLSVAVTGHMTGPWAESGGTVDPDGLSQFVCAPFAIDSASGGGNTGVSDLVAEATFAGGTAPGFLYGSANLCVIDTGTTNQVRIRLTRQGAADVAAFQAIFGTAPAVFHVQVIGNLPSRIYDSNAGTFDTDSLLGLQTLPMTLKLQIRDNADLVTPWYLANVTGTETFSFAAQ